MESYVVLAIRKSKEFHHTLFVLPLEGHEWSGRAMSTSLRGVPVATFAVIGGRPMVGPHTKPALAPTN